MRKTEKIRYFVLGMVVTLIFSATVVPVLAAALQKTITVTYNSLKIVVDGQTITPKDGNGKVVEPFVFEGTNYLPLRALGNAFGYSNDDIYWDSATNTVYFNSSSIGVNEDDDGQTDYDPDYDYDMGSTKD